MVTSPTDLVRIEESPDLVTVRFDRPEKRNAVDLDVIAGLQAVVRQIRAVGEKGILFTGSGPVTCAGADLTVLTGDDAEARSRLIRGFAAVFDDVQDHPRPTVMAAKGAIVGGGCQLATVCDFTVIGEETAYFKPEVQYGVMSQYTTSLLRHVAGPRAAREITLTGTPLPPERVAALGLAVDVVPEDEVEPTAAELARELCSYEEEAYARGKAVFEFEKSPADFLE